MSLAKLLHPVGLKSNNFSTQIAQQFPNQTNPYPVVSPTDPSYFNPGYGTRFNSNGSVDFSGSRATYPLLPRVNNSDLLRPASGYRPAPGLIYKKGHEGEVDWPATNAAMEAYQHSQER